MKPPLLIASTLVSLGLLRPAAAQTFVNLDFEAATIAPTAVNQGYLNADPTEAFPGWTVNAQYVDYNELTLDAASANLIGPDFPNLSNITPLQGSYSAFLLFNGYGNLPTLSETGLVPFDCQSLNFLVSASPGWNHPVVTLGGVNIPMVQLPDGRMGGDISAFAGTMAELTFAPDPLSTPGAPEWLYFDDVQFSSSPIPEPAGLVVLALGGSLICFRRATRMINCRTCCHASFSARRSSSR